MCQVAGNTKTNFRTQNTLHKIVGHTHTPKAIVIFYQFAKTWTQVSTTRTGTHLQTHLCFFISTVLTWFHTTCPGKRGDILHYTAGGYYMISKPVEKQGEHLVNRSFYSKLYLCFPSMKLFELTLLRQLLVENDQGSKVLPLSDAYSLGILGDKH